MADKVMIIDGNSLGKASYGAGLNFSTKSGLRTGVPFLFLRTYKMLLKEEQPKFTFITWDSWPTWRNQVLMTYKASRTRTEGYSEQREILQNFLLVMGKNAQIWAEHNEADDIAADIIRENPTKEFLLVTEDSDWFQLVGDNVTIYRHKKKDYVTKANFLKTTGYLDPDELVEVKALLGDSTDEVPGLNGINKETCIQFIRGKLNPCPEKERMEEYQKTDGYKRMRSIIELRATNIPKSLLTIKKGIWTPSEFIFMAEKAEFKSFIKDMENWRKLMEIQ
jgi:DNA polymerase-1